MTSLARCIAQDGGLVRQGPVDSNLRVFAFSDSTLRALTSGRGSCSHGVVEVGAGSVNLACGPGCFFGGTGGRSSAGVLKDAAQKLRNRGCLPGALQATRVAFKSP